MINLITVWNTEHKQYEIIPSLQCGLYNKQTNKQTNKRTDRQTEKSLFKFGELFSDATALQEGRHYIKNSYIQF
jgi:hypothetical protein